MDTRLHRIGICGYGYGYDIHFFFCLLKLQARMMSTGFRTTSVSQCREGIVDLNGGAFCRTCSRHCGWSGVPTVSQQVAYSTSRVLLAAAAHALVMQLIWLRDRWDGRGVVIVDRFVTVVDSERRPSVWLGAGPRSSGHASGRPGAHAHDVPCQPIGHWNITPSTPVRIYAVDYLTPP